ncbi:MAG: S9 family peptidase [Sedimentisphaerales bacterium]|nr:S9 family peptidase [Sedimentisphaerales bacterium]
MLPEQNLSVVRAVTKAVLLVTVTILSTAPGLRAEGKSSESVTAAKPYAYLYPAAMEALTQHLQRQKVDVQELREDIDLDVGVHRIKRVVEREGQGSSEALFRFKTRKRQETQRFGTGTILVKTEQDEAETLVRLLDPKAKKCPDERDLFDSMEQGDMFPVCTLDSYVPVRHGAVRPLAETRELHKPITFDTVYDRKERVNFNGQPIGGLTWLEDGDHYLQVRDGRLYKVHAASGRSVPFVDPTKVAAGLKRLPAMSEKDAESLSRRTWLRMNPDRTAILIDYQNDLYYCTLDGKTAVRLTSSPAREDYSTFAPDGKFVAFVRERDLYVVDVATQTERALTADGGGMLFNGEADWVYHEELYSRQRRLFWWSPDASALAFLQVDDTPVHSFTVVNNVPKEQGVEVCPYPRPGEANPLVKLGIVSVAGGPVRWVDLGAYTEGTCLITGAGWMPDSQRVYFYVQNRIQTWLDLCAVSRSGGKPECLLRDATEAWIESPGELTFLKDGAFLLSSERTGWKHLYLYDVKGQLQRAVTEGPWEARALHCVDEENGWVYFTATRDSHIAENLYRVKLDGGTIQRLTKQSGHHRVNVSPNGKRFIDSWSDCATPARTALCNGDGTHVRTLDTNPVYQREEYEFGAYRQFQIETSDGFLLEASLLEPPDFDPNCKYPVWFTTYGGPHAPTIRDTWSGGRAWDQMLARMGALVFGCDPRSASGKGACSAWKAYKQLGVQELADIEEAIAWLKDQPYVAGDRIGMSGHSYGGFMTAYALTHSDLFAGGIAGAPVTDWRLYDTIYTERYMDTPQNNPEGYERTSAVQAAAKLRGRLLLVHGAIDDNVHVQNTYQLIQALQRADRDFDVMVYPQSRHGIGGMHYSRLRVNFIKSVLRLSD